MKSVKQKFLRLIGTPEFIVRDQPEICMIGFERISVENYKTLIKYSDEEVCLRLIKGILQINGRKLVIRDIDMGRICIEGRVKEIFFREEV